jgi:hypothetical protein
MPRSIITVMPPAASTTSASTRSGETVPSSWRPPWFGHDHAVDAVLAREACIRGAHQPLHHQAPLPAAADLRELAPVEPVAPAKSRSTLRATIGAPRSARSSRNTSCRAG